MTEKQPLVLLSMSMRLGQCTSLVYIFTYVH